MQTDDQAKVDTWADKIDFQRYMSRYHPSNDTALRRIIQYDGQDIGYVWIEKEGKDESEGLLGVLIGDRQYWNQGIGQQAISLIIEEARQNFGIRSVSLRVRSQNVRAYHCYLANGFVVSEHSHKVSPDGEVYPIVTMRRTLI